jgi:uncharacterized repeat protein (TIGR02543 family)
VLYGSTFTTPANTYTRSGYTFAGWNDGSTTYAAGVTYPSSGTVAGPVTLTATWTAATLTVTYDSQGGSAISSGSTTVGGSISGSPGTPTRTGYTFNGWFVATSGGSQIVFPYTHGQTANFTLYAQWTAIPLAAPAFTLSPTSLSVTRDTSSSFYAITSTGGTVASWSISATPAGTTFNTATGLLSGTPTTADNSGTNYTITATNATGTAQQIFNLKVTNN